MNLFSSDIAEAIGLDLESVERNRERDYSGESQATYTIPVIFVGGRVGVPCRHVFHENIVSEWTRLARTEKGSLIYSTRYFDYPKQEVIIKAITA